MKKLFLSVVLLGYCIAFYAQIDNTSGFGIPAQASDGTTLSNSSFSSPDLNSSLIINKKDEKAENIFTSDNKKSFDISTDNGLLTRKYDYNPSWLTKDKQFSDEFYSGQNLGTFNTNAKSVEILCRDHQHVDGDRVALIHNGNVIIHRIELREYFQSFIIDLEDGQNIIEFQALNQGTSGPNTAHFRVFDENGVLIVENEWNLATGVKATLVVYRDGE